MGDPHDFIFNFEPNFHTVTAKNGSTDHYFWTQGIQIGDLEPNLELAETCLIVF